MRLHIGNHEIAGYNVTTWRDETGWVGRIEGYDQHDDWRCLDTLPEMTEDDAVNKARSVVRELEAGLC